MHKHRHARGSEQKLYTGECLSESVVVENTIYCTVFVSLMQPLYYYQQTYLSEKHHEVFPATYGALHDKHWSLFSVFFSYLGKLLRTISAMSLVTHFPTSLDVFFSKEANLQEI